MRLGLITPVFDGCLKSLELLFTEVYRQSHKDWSWIICSNGQSEKIADFAGEKNKLLASYNSGLLRRMGLGKRPELHYIYLPYQETQGPWSLLKEIGRRRDFCIREIKADYIFMLDADAKLLDMDMFKVIDNKLAKDPKDICVYRVEHMSGILPRFPISYGHIDMLNFCLKASLAKRIGYPTDVSPEGIANDYRYFEAAMRETNGDYLFIDKVLGRHNGNNNDTYFNIIRQIHEGNEAR